MITVKLTGDRDLIGKLNAMPAAVQQALLRKTTSLALQLEALVKQKLSGLVLKVRSGNLRDSIHNNVNATDTSVTGRVFSDKSVKYAAIHEFGGTTSPHVILPVKAQALAFMAGGKMVFAKRVNHPGSKIPARPYMKPSLEEMAPTIISGLKRAVNEGIQ